MFEPISIDHMTSEMLRQTEHSLISEVAGNLLVLENQEDLYRCDYLADSVLKLHDSFKAIMPVLKRTGSINIIDLNILNNALKELHSTLQSVIPQDELYTVSEDSSGYGTLEEDLIDIFRVCKTIVVSDWYDNNPGNSYMIEAAMCCADTILSCVKFIDRLIRKRTCYAMDHINPYSRNIKQLNSILYDNEED